MQTSSVKQIEPVCRITKAWFTLAIFFGDLENDTHSIRPKAEKIDWQNRQCEGNNKKEIFGLITIPPPEKYEDLFFR
jgi:hypothetical protein